MNYYRFQLSREIEILNQGCKHIAQGSAHLLWGRENIIIIGQLSENHRKPRCLIERRPIRDRHTWSETYWRPTCLNGDLDMLHRRSIRDRHSWLETNTHRRRPDEDQHGCVVQSDSKRINQIYLFLHTLCLVLIFLNNVRSLITVHDRSGESLISHVSLLSGFQFQIGLRSGMSVFDGSPIRHVGLQWVFNGSPMRLLFTWTQLFRINSLK